MLYLAHSRMWLVSSTFRACCQIFFCAAALNHLTFQFIYITRIALSQMENMTLALVKFHVAGDVIAHLFSLSRSLCKASLPSRESTMPPSWVSSANLHNVHLTPASRWFITTLKCTKPKKKMCAFFTFLPKFLYVVRNFCFVLFSCCINTDSSADRAMLNLIAFLT